MNDPFFLHTGDNSIDFFRILSPFPISFTARVDKWTITQSTTIEENVRVKVNMT